MFAPACSVFFSNIKFLQTKVLRRLLFRAFLRSFFNLELPRSHICLQTWCVEQFPGQTSLNSSYSHDYPEKYHTDTQYLRKRISK